MICLLCLPLLAIWTSSKAKLSTVDCLEADRLEFYYRIAAQVQRNRVSKLWKLSRSWYACAVMNIVDTPSGIVVACLASDCITKAVHCIMTAVQKSCMHASAVAVFVEWWIVVFVDIMSIRAPRHQHLWCYFSVRYFSFAAHAERRALKLAMQVELDIISLFNI